MNYELDVLAALIQLPEPTTQEIVSATGISERKVQNVIKALQSDLKMTINKSKAGRSVRYTLINWGVFESGKELQKELIGRPLQKGQKANSYKDKAAFYDSVKLSNYRESARLEV